MKEEEVLRIRIMISGAVQGVGFRPFVYRIATEEGLKGWVNNSSRGVSIEVEGERRGLESFRLRLDREKPPRSSIQSLESSYLDPVGYRKFEIRESDGSGEKTTLVLPDIATCHECLEEIFDPEDRRYGYPFTNCTNCGPRFSIIEALPYDRRNTTMRHFVMCDACREEYEDPLNRRFHAQPNGCPLCGPHLELWTGRGEVLESREDALHEAALAIRMGKIVAVKGLGGFHLVVDSRREEAVLRLRERKLREEKPFALMYPSLKSAEEDCEISSLEERLLTSPESPIVLLKRRVHKSGDDRSPAWAVAPRNPYLGILLPYTPLHHLLMAELGFPVVATSGNLSDEPISTDERDALLRLGGIADLFLVHNRPIARHVDDSIVRVMAGRSLLLRRARGYAPLPIRLKEPMGSILAVGGHLKNTIAVSVGRDVFISQHIGDLETQQAFKAFKQVIQSFYRLYDFKPQGIACDAHPDYLSTQFARKNGVPVFPVQHHFAHVLSCMAENELEGDLLGISWDGAGYGLDGTLWGGEFLHVKEGSFRRIGHFRSFPLPGGEKAIREPRRAAIGLLHEIFGGSLFSMKGIAPIQSFREKELVILKRILERRINTPLTTSAGRIFDIVSSLIDLRQITSFEGQASMELEYALEGIGTEENYPFRISECKVGNNTIQYIVDWEPLMRQILKDLEREVPKGEISAKFHNTLVETILAIASRVGERKLVLTGGSFQNRYLTERAIRRLKEKGFQPYWHQRVPPNDGGIVLGQAFAFSLSQKQEG